MKAFHSIHCFLASRSQMKVVVCFALESNCDLPSLTFDTNRLEREMLGDLTLVRGVGEVTQRRLKARGYQTIIDLTTHPKFRPVARQVLELLPVLTRLM